MSSPRSEGYRRLVAKLGTNLLTRGTPYLDLGVMSSLVDADLLALLTDTQGHKSLLPAGMAAAEGDFDRGDVTRIMDGQGREMACGISNYSSADLQRIQGCHSDDILSILCYEYGEEVVHRNNLVLL